MLTGQMFHPISVNEAGTGVGARAAVTGTEAGGRWSQDSCGDWNDPMAQGTLGSTVVVGSLFTRGALFTCDGVLEGSLLCFGTDRAVRVEPRRSTGRLAFVSRGLFSSGGGVAAADALCQSEAAAAGLGGSFLAEMALADTLPEARFDLNGPPWVRPDGVLVADTAAAYFHDEFIRSPPTVTVQGEYRPEIYAWYGQDRLGQTTADSTCANWASTTGTSGVLAFANSTAQLAVVVVGEPCVNPHPVICLEN
jgi:hypothetical protein